MKRRFFAVTVAGMFCACGALGGMSSTLSRAKAKELINALPAFAVLPTGRAMAGTVNELPLTAPPDACAAEGFCFPNGHLTAEGKRHFENLDWHFKRLTPVLQARRVVTEITGVADVDSPMGKEGFAQVEFQWAYEGLSDVVVRYSGQTAGITHPGTARFQRFDDGWRIQQFDGRPVIDVRDVTNRAPFVWDDSRVTRTEARVERERMSRIPTKTLFTYQWGGLPVRAPTNPGELRYESWNEIGATDVGFFFSPTGSNMRRQVSYGDSKRPTCTDYGGYFEITVSDYIFHNTGPGSNQARFEAKGTTKIRMSAQDRLHRGGEGSYPEALKTACEQLLHAYDAWRAQYPGLGNR